MRKINIILFSVLLVSFISACGFYSFTGASIPPQATTFSVNHFPNLAPMIQPTLSQIFTDALKDQFTRQTNLRLTNGVGDLHFEGNISGYNIRPQAIGADDRAAQNRLTISVRVKFINEYQPENDFEKTFSRYYDYNSERSLAEVENEAIAIITEALVEDIFNSAVVNW
jgi:outer membrane lipopolysaccharide assembly protein LptE/RlpB